MKNVTETTPATIGADAAVAQLRHLYDNLANDGVRDTAQAKRIAEGLLAPAIVTLERAALASAAQPPRPQAYQRAVESVRLLADILNLRPALNAGLRDAYTHWTGEVYAPMGAMAAESANDEATAPAALVSAQAVPQPAAPQGDALDTERLEWLIEQGNCVVRRGINGFWVYWIGEFDSKRSRIQNQAFPTARAAIDAARAKEGGAI